MNRYVGRFPGNFHYVIIAQVCKSGFVRRRPRMRCPLVGSASHVWSASFALECLIVLADARFRILSHSRHGGSALVTCRSSSVSHSTLCWSVCRSQPLHLLTRSSDVRGGRDRTHGRRRVSAVEDTLCACRSRRPSPTGCHGSRLSPPPPCSLLPERTHSAAARMACPHNSSDPRAETPLLTPSNRAAFCGRAGPHSALFGALLLSLSVLRFFQSHFANAFVIEAAFSTLAGNSRCTPTTNVAGTVAAVRARSRRARVRVDKQNMRT